MAQSKCGFCQGRGFVLSIEYPTESRRPISVVRCASCDAPIGILHQEDPNVTIRDAEKRLADRIQRAEERLIKEIQDQLAAPSS